MRLRYAARCADAATAQMIGEEVESLYLCGPAAGGGVTKSVRETVAIASTLIPSDEVSISAEIQGETHEVA